MYNLVASNRDQLQTDATDLGGDAIGRANGRLAAVSAVTKLFDCLGQRSNFGPQSGSLVVFHENAGRFGAE